ncbi:MAG: hypothetical protein FWG45_04585 [Oscillospiraceae bacterium]|nr:hypothetical protein [Oscillospiraceae bacterium]
MAQTETRHAEKSKLFSLYEVKYGGNVDLQIAHAEASMEKEDVDDVRARFELWKNIKTDN